MGNIWSNLSKQIQQAGGTVDTNPPGSPRRSLACGQRVCPYDFTTRTSIRDDAIGIYGWPSRGGVIILDDTQAVGFEFLGLDPLDPQIKRDHGQDAEDAFCQRLLLLGAKWWDSLHRYDVVCLLKAGQLLEILRYHGHPPPTMRQKRWVCVAWPSTGGLWVAECDPSGDKGGKEDMPPDDARLAKFRLARTMDERCLLLKRDFNAKFYEKIEDYHKSHTFLRAWGWKRTGEAGSKMLTNGETIDEWRGSNQPRCRLE